MSVDQHSAPAHACERAADVAKAPIELRLRRQAVDPYALPTELANLHRKLQQFKLFPRPVHLIIRRESSEPERGTVPPSKNPGCADDFCTRGLQLRVGGEEEGTRGLGEHVPMLLCLVKIVVPVKGQGQARG